MTPPKTPVSGGELSAVAARRPRYTTPNPNPNTTTNPDTNPNRNPNRNPNPDPSPNPNPNLRRLGYRHALGLRIAHELAHLVVRSQGWA